MEEFQEIISEEQATTFVHEMYRIHRKGGLPILIAPPGAGKTTKVIIKLIDLLKRVVVSFPYHPIISQFYNLIKDRRAVALAGGRELCLGEINGEFRYFTGRCQFCRHSSKSVPLQFPTHYADLRKLAHNGMCPYAVLKDNALKADVIIKTHKFVVKRDRMLIYDEVHQDVLGRIVVRERTPYCKKTRGELFAELEELRQKCLMETCDDEAVEKIELLQDLLNGECHNVEDSSVLLLKNPPQKIDFGLTATPPERVPRRWDVIKVEIKSKPKLVVVPNIRTARPFDASDFLALYEYLKKLYNNDIYVAAPQRLLDNINSDRKFAIWGRESHGLTYSSSAILVAEPWLHIAAYEKLPYVATQLTLVQMIQVIGRIRPWNRPSARVAYTVGQIVEKHENYFAEFFNIEFALWDGQALRKI